MGIAAGSESDATGITAGFTAGSSPVGRAVRSRNRRGEGTRLRADILAAATDLLNHGDERAVTLRAVTLRAVARKAGIAAPSIYPHFPDRPAIMLAVVREAFGELSSRLGAAVDAAGDDPRQRLYAACHAYLDFAAAHPERYRAMFGEAAEVAMSGDVRNSIATDIATDIATNGGAFNGRALADDPACPGARTLRILVGILADCVAAGYSTSTDPFADAVALWLGLHGFAHQRAVTYTFPWPADLVRRFVSPLSHIGPIRSRTSPAS